MPPVGPGRIARDKACRKSGRMSRLLAQFGYVDQASHPPGQRTGAPGRPARRRGRGDRRAGRRGHDPPGDRNPGRDVDVDDELLLLLARPAGRRRAARGRRAHRAAGGCRDGAGRRQRAEPPRGDRPVRRRGDVRAGTRHGRAVRDLPRVPPPAAAAAHRPPDHGEHRARRRGVIARPGDRPRRPAGADGRGAARRPRPAPARPAPGGLRPAAPHRGAVLPAPRLRRGRRRRRRRRPPTNAPRAPGCRTSRRAGRR